MTLADVLTKCQQQMRLSPLSDDQSLVNWLNQAIRRFGIRSKFLDKWMIIPCKANVARYLLPGDHITTVAAFYDEVRLQDCTAFDAQQVSPDSPVYYYEDEWSDESSQGLVSEFTLHYGLCEWWPLQLMRSQNAYGRKTITLVAAPLADGTATTFGEAVTGTLDGTVTADTVYWADTSGIPYNVTTSAGNLLLFYKAFDTIPETAADQIVWNDVLASAYTCGTLSMSLSGEDDEYDRYRAWLYSYLMDSMADSLQKMAINKAIR